MELVPLGGTRERRKFPSAWETPSPARISAGTERELQKLGEEGSIWLGVGRTDGPCHFAALISPSYLPAGVCGAWVLKLCLWWTGSGKELGSTAWRQPEGPSVWSELQVGVCTEQSTDLT